MEEKCKAYENLPFEIAGCPKKGSEGRNLQETEVPNYISRPVVCSNLGVAILFENLNNETYPVYDRDNLLNTNDNFDYSDFTKLE